MNTGLNFNIQVYRWLPSYEAKWQYITECVMPYIKAENGLQLEGLIRELKFAAIQVEDNITFTGHEGSLRSEIEDDERIRRRLAAELRHYQIYIHRMPSFYKEGDAGELVYGVSPERLAQFGKLRETKKDAEGKVIQYTFEDWMKNVFISECDSLGEPIYNDSEKYIELVDRGNMTYEVLNKIQDAQAEVYELLIQKSLSERKRIFSLNINKSADPSSLLRLTIEQNEQYLNQHKNILNAIVNRQLHRGRKYGAKFISAEMYNKRNGYLYAFSSYPISHFDEMIGGHIYDGRPTEDQMIYSRVETTIIFLEYLKTAATSSSKSKNEQGEQGRFNCEMSQGQINILYQGLLNYDYIKSDTTFSDFLALFLGKDSITIQWFGSSRLFAYMFNRLYESKLINEKNWKSVIEKNKYFKKKDGKLFNSNLLSSNSHKMGETNKAPDGYLNVESIINKIKSSENKG